MKKKIAIYAHSLGENSFGVNKSYLDFAMQYGDVRILTNHEPYRADIDLLLLVGGADVNPSIYDQVPGLYTSNTDVHKQYTFTHCLPNYVKNGKKVFGICLGMQQLNIHFGGQMTQNLPCHKQSKEDHLPGHKVFIEQFAFLPANVKDVEVTSTHHQGILRHQLSPEFNSLFYSKNEEYQEEKSITEVDIIEGIMHKELPIAGVQSHPERYCPGYIDNLFRHILEL
jgi:putative glutamine amidotransferase